MNVNQAKQIQIADYLHTLGYNPTKIQGYNYWYRSPYREERTASFKVNTQNNTWYDFGTGDRGNIIDLVLRMEVCSVEMALRKLAGIGAYVHIGSNANVQTDSSFFQSKNILQDTNPVTIVQNILPITHPKLIEWVGKRKIDLDLANKYCREIHYHNQNGDHFSVGFKNDNGGYELSSPPNFKGCIAPKDITTIRNNRDTCLAFEGFWDFLSYLTIQKQERTTHDVAVLNSIVNVEKTMSFLKTHKEIYTYLDNDEGGRKATELIKSANATVYNRSSQFAEYKDLNDFLREIPKAKLPMKKKNLGLKL
jgi:hypothetical protein